MKRKGESKRQDSKDGFEGKGNGDALQGKGSGKQVSTSNEKQGSTSNEKQGSTSNEKQGSTSSLGQANNGVISRIAGILSFLYSFVPTLPFIDKATSTIIILAIVAYFLLVGAVVFSMPMGVSPPYLAEAPLQKNSHLMLLPGEEYVYFVESIAGNETVGYEVLSEKGCRGIKVVEDTIPMGVCLSSEGNDANDPLKLNSSLGNSSILLFSPWMLGVSNNFEWRVENKFSVGGTEVAFPIIFKSLGDEEIAGRQTYHVKITSEFDENYDYYIDKEKRVLVMGIFGNSSIKLVSAPFELNWSNR